MMRLQSRRFPPSSTSVPVTHPRNLHSRLRRPCSNNGHIQPTDKSVVILPGLGNASSDYEALKGTLEDLGHSVEICRVNRVDWIRNAAGLRDGNYWKGTLNPRPTVDWYLHRIEEALESIKQKTEGVPISLLAHSAGGWLGRIYMKDFGTYGIESFITLGSPHSPPPKDKPGVFDQTRGILSFVEQEMPGCYHSDVQYVTVAGKYMKGCGIRDSGSLEQKFTGVVYQQVCGEAAVWGDGVVPNVSSHLDGAINLELIDVFHSPFQSAVSAHEHENEDNTRVWYGSKGIAEKWLNCLEPSYNKSTK